ncbi:MAG TPA: KpsF/GutQ family sugar-phosphate isomerase [Myxococcota bacterium]|nr:KpsF/GutQ family sugar-phosphate isomerase [Myxococcota bacterium]
MPLAPKRRMPLAAQVSPEAPAVDAAQVLRDAREVIEAEAQAVLRLRERLEDGAFVACVQHLLACRGRIVVTGMGKSGLVGQKISATFASTGAPSLFMHAAEAIHGDLGRITAEDVVLALSNSGESDEIIRLIRPVKGLGAVLLALTGDGQSTLARGADAAILMGNVAEACPMGLVPTASTTVMLVLGDALAMCLFNRRGLGAEAYARFHPGGALGRKLMKVREVMRAGNANPVARVSDSLRRVIAIMTETEGRPGAASIVDAEGKLAGFFTDGDLRRLLERAEFAVDAPVGSVMHLNPKRIHPETLVAEAAQILRSFQIDQLPVVDADDVPIGLLDVQDVLSAR